MRPFCNLTVVVVYILGSAWTCGVCNAENVQLFNGQNIDGWTAGDETSLNHWVASEGMLVGENADKKGSILWTNKDFTDYELDLEYMTPSEDYDSGVYTRGRTHQVQIGVSRSLKKDLTACIYAPKDKQGSYPAVSDKVAKTHKLGEWNTLRIVVKGKRVQTFLNGEPFVDYETVVMPESGPIGMQLHAGVHQKMYFRNIQLKENSLR